MILFCKNNRWDNILKLLIINQLIGVERIKKMTASSIANIITSRHSVRAFTSKKVPKSVITDILSTASYAPSGSNTQPWKVYVTTGEVRDAIVNDVCQVYDDLLQHPELKVRYQPTYDYYPQKWFSPYIERRRENGWGLYGTLGIEKKDRDKIATQHKRNYVFFDAPVGIFVTVHKKLGTGSKMDISMFIQNILLMAKAKGLDTCPQAAWNEFQSIILAKINATEDEVLLGAIALGYADKENIVNGFITPRVPADEFTTYLGFNE